MKKILITLSVLLNALTAALCITAAAGRRSFLSYPALNPAGAACVVSLPDAAALSFGTLEVSLKKGESCFIQFSLVQNKKQLDFMFTPLYDHRIARVTPYQTGMLVSALAEGDCLLQSVSDEGIKTIAVITVSE